MASKKKGPAPKATPKATAKKTGDTGVGVYGKSGEYKGASSPIQLAGKYSGGMSAKMAAAIAKNPKDYKGYADSTGGKAVYGKPSTSY